MQERIIALASTRKVPWYSNRREVVSVVLCDIRGMMPAVCELLFLEESAQQDMYGLDWFKAAWQRVGEKMG